MKAKLVKVEPAAENIKTFWFEPEASVDWVPGQYTRAYLPHDNPDERGDKHWFTVSASPTEKLMSITTKFSHPSSSFKTTLSQLPIGIEVDLAQPIGDFVLPKDAKIPLVFVAGGIGCTPYRSICKWLADSGQKRNIQMIYAVSDQEELAFKELFEQNTKLITVIGERLNAAKILELIGGFKNQLIYVAGPEPMVEALVDDLEQASVPKNNLVTDYFPGYQSI